MKLVPQSSPYIRKNVSVARMMTDVIIALMPVTIFAMIQNGWNGIYVFLISIATMVFFELLCHMFIKWPKGMKFKELFSKEGFSKVKANYTINNILAPIISALIFALIMPAGCNGYVVFTGAAFGIIIGKMVFGGLGSNIFNPAATARIFSSICFGSQIGAANIISGGAVIADATPLAGIKANGVLNLANNPYSLLDLFLGNVPGAMGEVSALLILVGAVYLFVRRSADLRSFLSYLCSFAFVMLIASISFLKVDSSINVFNVWMYQVLSGGMLFAAVFMVTDPVTSPTSKFGRILFGTIAGTVTALIRIVGAYPEGAAFSILIANMLVPTIDHFMRGKPNTYTWKQCLITAVYMLAICGIVTAYVMTTGGSL